MNTRYLGYNIMGSITFSGYTKNGVLTSSLDLKNNAYLMDIMLANCRQTQQQWFSGKEIAVDSKRPLIPPIIM